jgi:hypothetical protein
MWKFFQSDQNGTPAVFEDGMQVVTQFTCPPLLPQKNKVFSQKFTTDGLASGTNDMGINGAVTPTEYFIPADPDNDRYITRISFILGYGSSAEMYEFADSGGALTNGVQVSYTNTYLETVITASIKANYSFMRASGNPISITGWESRGFAASGDYGFFVNIPIAATVPPYGIKLDRGTVQKMSILIQDDCTDADLFNCAAFGFERFE